MQSERWCLQHLFLTFVAVSVIYCCVTSNHKSQGHAMSLYLSASPADLSWTQAGGSRLQIGKVYPMGSLSPLDQQATQVYSYRDGSAARQQTGTRDGFGSLG